MGLTRYPPALAAALEKIEAKGSTVEGQSVVTWPTFLPRRTRRGAGGGRRRPNVVAGTDRGPPRTVTLSICRYTMRSKLSALAAGTAAVMVLGGCAGHHRAAAIPTTTSSIATTTTVAPTTTTVKPDPVAAHRPSRRADAAQIHQTGRSGQRSTPSMQARPQTGINQSDIVYEQMVEAWSHSTRGHLPVSVPAGRRPREIGPADRRGHRG